MDDALEQVGLAGIDRRPVRAYSLGMRQRLGLAAALLGEPELLILDEPANGLDPEGVRWLRDFLRAFAAEGRTVFVSSHVMDEAGRCDRVLLMRDGGLIADATPDGLRADAGTDDLEEAFLVLAERDAA